MCRVLYSCEQTIVCVYNCSCTLWTWILVWTALCVYFSMLCKCQVSQYFNPCLFSCVFLAGTMVWWCDHLWKQTNSKSHGRWEAWKPERGPLITVSPNSLEKNREDKQKISQILHNVIKDRDTTRSEVQTLSEQLKKALATIGELTGELQNTCVRMQEL